MTSNSNKAVSILFAVMIIVLPMGWILISNEPAGPYFTTDSGKVQAALKATGLNLCKQTEFTWQVPGALGGNSILVSDDCQGSEPGNAIFIHTQKLDSEKNRDAAIRLIQKSIYMNDINGAVYTYGSYVIAVQGPPGGSPITEVLSKVKDQLKK